MQHSGCLKHMKEFDMRRMILAMLTQKILKESFVAIKYGRNVMVYIQKGRHSDAFFIGKGAVSNVYITDGIDTKEKMDFQESDVESDKKSAKKRGRPASPEKSSAAKIKMPKKKKPVVEKPEAAAAVAAAESDKPSLREYAE